MDRAKVQLSTAEMTLVCDPVWILTKNTILSKVVAVMAALSDRYAAIYTPLTEGHPKTEDLPASIQIAYDGLTPDRLGLPPTQPPKISKGENYRGLPYVMLDYPRIFGRQDVFAIRTMFWWGHYFSVTLHLKGIYKELYGPVIGRHIGQAGSALKDGLTSNGFHLGISEEEWRHELTAGNYTSLEASAPIVIERTLREHPFLKLSATCGLDRWDEAPEEMLRLFETLLGSMNSPEGKTNFPGGETNP